MQRVVPIQVVRLIFQTVEEEIGRRLPRTVHVWNAIRPEPLRPIVKAAGFGEVNQSERLSTVGGNALLVEVDPDMRDQRLPTQLQQELRIIEGPSRSVHDVSTDAAGLASRERFLAEFQERVLSRESLPAVRTKPERGIDATGGIIRHRTGFRCASRE